MEIWKKSIELKLDGVVANEQMVCFFISDGRSISLSMSLFPDMCDGSHDAIRNYQVNDEDQTVHWPEFNKTITLAEVLRN